MIDIENIIIDTVKKAVIAAHGSAYPELNVQGQSIDVPSDFPCVTVEEIGNTTYRRTQEVATMEREATVTYAINVYTNNSSNKKTVAKKIAKTVDATMQGLYFTRLVNTPTPNIDRSIYRITMRYEAVVGTKVGTGSNAYYPIYRR